MGNRVSGGGKDLKTLRREGHGLISGTEGKLECFRSRGQGGGRDIGTK